MKISDIEEIHFGHLPYKLKVEEGKLIRPSEDSEIEAEKEFLGLVSFKERTIYISGDLDPQVQRSTLWHEILHIVVEHAGHNLEEGAILALENGILGLLHQNPWLAKFITE